MLAMNMVMSIETIAALNHNLVSVLEKMDSREASRGTTLWHKVVKQPLPSDDEEAIGGSEHEVENRAFNIGDTSVLKTLQDQLGYLQTLLSETLKGGINVYETPVYSELVSNLNEFFKKYNTEIIRLVGMMPNTTVLPLLTEGQARIFEELVFNAQVLVSNKKNSNPEEMLTAAAPENLQEISSWLSIMYASVFLERIEHLRKCALLHLIFSNDSAENIIGILDKAHGND